MAKKKKGNALGATTGLGVTGRDTSGYMSLSDLGFSTPYANAFQAAGITSLPSYMKRFAGSDFYDISNPNDLVTQYQKIAGVNPATKGGGKASDVLTKMGWTVGGDGQLKFTGGLLDEPVMAGGLAGDDPARAAVGARTAADPTRQWTDADQLKFEEDWLRRKIKPNSGGTLGTLTDPKFWGGMAAIAAPVAGVYGLPAVAGGGAAAGGSTGLTSGLTAGSDILAGVGGGTTIGGSLSGMGGGSLLGGLGLTSLATGDNMADWSFGDLFSGMKAKDWLDLGKTAVGLGGSLFGAFKGKGSIDDAVNAANKASKQGVDFQKYMYDTAMANYEPFRQLGLGAIPGMSGVDPTGGAGDFLTKLGDLSSNFKFNEEDPAYKYKMDQSTKNINQQLAARGLYNSRAGLNLQDESGRAIMADEYDKQYGRAYSSLMDQFNMSSKLGATNYSKLMDLIKIGTGASSSAGNAAMQLGQGVASSYGQMGGYDILGGQAGADFWSGLGAMPMNYLLLSQMLSGGNKTTPSAGKVPYMPGY